MAALSYSSIQEVYLVITLCRGLLTAMHSSITVYYTSMVMIVCSRVISVVDPEGVPVPGANLRGALFWKSACNDAHACSVSD